MARGSIANRLDLAGSDELARSIAERANTRRNEIASAVNIGYQPDRSLEIVLQELETVLEKIEYGVFLMDADMRAQLINSAFRKMWNVDDQFALGNPDFFEMIEYLRDRGAYDVSDDQWPAYVKSRYEAVRTADGVARESQRADGRVLLYKCLPLPLGGRMLTYFDITDQKRVETELAESKQSLIERVHELELLKLQLQSERDRAVSAADAIAENRELLSEVIENIHEAILVWDEDGKLVVSNQRIRHIYPDLADLFRPGLALEDMIREGYRRGVFPAPEGGGEDELVAEWSAKNEAGRTIDEREMGDGRWIRLHRRKAGRGKRVVTITDITAERENVAQITELASSDGLTGLANRRAFDQALARFVGESAHAARSIGLLLIDLDKFKATNDEYGHPAGDAVLREVAARLTGCLRKSDIASRIGGDEFAAIVTDVTDDEPLAQLASRIVEAMAEPVLFESRKLTCGVSIGGALCRQDSDDASDLIARADHALYTAKQAGRGTARLYSQIKPAG